MVLVELPEWAAIAPVLILAATGMALFLYDTVRPRSGARGTLCGIAVVGSLLALATTVWYLLEGVGDPARRGVFELFGDQLVVDQLALFFVLIVTVVTAMVAIASYDYMGEHAYQAEYYSLVMLAATGMATMAIANSLVTAFIAIELASLPSYALVAILKRNRGSVEAGLKYFLIGALSSAILLYGISLVYGATGALQLDLVAAGLGEAEDFAGLLGLGVLMILGGVAFKTTSVPFHFWAPDAYEGAPAPISAFISSASKAAGFVIAIRIFTQAFPMDAMGTIGVDWAFAFAILAALTMTLGNFAAAVQENVKRMLAYSSIGHAGFALIGLAGLTGTGDDAMILGAALMHLLVYGFMNTGAFLFVALAEYWGIGRRYEDYAGLAWSAPIACVAMAVFMFSLAGLPPFAGFFSKLFLFMGAVNAGLAWLAGLAVLNSVLSLYFYSRVVKALWIDAPTGERGSLARPTGLYLTILLAAVATVLLLPAFGPVAETAVEAATILLS